MAIGTSGTLTQEFVDKLSAELILEPDAQYVFAQLAQAARAGAMGIPGIMGRAGTAANMDKAMGAGLGTLRMMNPRWMSVARDFAKVVSDPTTPGKVILIDQPRYLGGSFAEAARRLTEGTPVAAAPVPPTMGQVTVTIREYGGPHDGSDVAPIGISDYLKRRATHDLVAYLGLLLRRDRNRFVDRAIVDLMLTTTNVTTPGDTAEDDLVADQLMTEDVLSEILFQLQTRNIPTFSNGMYMLVIGPKHLKDLKGDEKFRESVRYLGTDGALVQGHIANHGGFMIVEANSIPNSDVGGGGGGGVVGFQALAFGPEAIGWAIGMDTEARPSKDDDYGREDRVLWIAHEGWQLLDADFVERITTT
jgi:N4-gp56 family major capsid protein